MKRKLFSILLLLPILIFSGCGIKSVSIEFNTNNQENGNSTSEETDIEQLNTDPTIENIDSFEEWVSGSEIDWFEAEAKVESISQSGVLIQINDETFKVNNQVYRFMEREEFPIKENDQLIIWAYLDNGDLTLGKIQNLETEKTIFVRDNTGKPLWSANNPENEGTLPESNQQTETPETAENEPASEPISFSEWTANTGVEWFEISATVLSVNQSEVVLQLEDETEIINGRTYRFLKEKEFFLSEGDQLIIWAFIGEGEWNPGMINNLTVDQIIFIRSARGKPEW